MPAEATRWSSLCRAFSAASLARQERVDTRAGCVLASSTNPKDSVATPRKFLVEAILRLPRVDGTRFGEQDLPLPGYASAVTQQKQSLAERTPGWRFLTAAFQGVSSQRDTTPRCVQPFDHPKASVDTQGLVEAILVGIADERGCQGTRARSANKSHAELLEFQGLRDFVWRQVVGDHASIVELLPLLAREVEHFRFTYRERDNKSVRQIAEYGQ